MLDIEKAIYNPASVFKRPAEVLKTDIPLSTAQKIELLERWAYDVKEREVAEEENMHSDTQVDILDEILLALNQLRSLEQNK
jgi:hypothetical protein